MQIINELEDAADLCRLDTQTPNQADAIRVVGRKDRLFTEKAMTKDISESSEHCGGNGRQQVQ